ncbi:POPCORN [Hibiscus trionum]|uniref:POPCORN n=1 Tax=Hibiscus trionum TaxID=183268 RepID=A0A9W7I639_HIBTR|nr:POPCORN [Hibiscus trionum]
MCSIDFGKAAVDEDDESELVHEALLKLQGSLTKRKLKHLLRKGRQKESKQFDIISFRDPILFIGHIARNSILILDKPWMEVIKSFDTVPVQRHVYGT